MLRVAIAGCLLLIVATAQGAEFQLKRHDGGVEVLLDGQLFTNYRTDKGPKPILFPIIGPTGAAMTRSYPIETPQEGERIDHPHHRSFWFTHGNVGGVDFWSEREGGHGSIIQREVVKVAGGDTGEISVICDWMSPDGKKILEDERTYTFSASGDARVIDFDITLTASDQDVKFGDTKEGTFGIRVPTSIDVDTKKGGAIVNSSGQRDRGAWGKPAEWVDYHGPVDGETVGVAILNHPSSFRFPTHWHVRTYGLFAANPFGLHDFKGDDDVDGSHVLAAGESITLRYRVIFHRGDQDAAGIAEAFSRYAAEQK